MYVRAEAYLSAQQSQLAAGEFQKILDHRGLLWNCATGALTHLGLARAYALQGDTGKVRAVYQDFLALWKDADPDVPVLKEAKAEYAKAAYSGVLTLWKDATPTCLSRARAPQGIVGPGHFCL